MKVSKLFELQFQYLGNLSLYFQLSQHQTHQLVLSAITSKYICILLIFHLALRIILQFKPPYLTEESYSSLFSGLLHLLMLTLPSTNHTETKWYFHTLHWPPDTLVIKFELLAMPRPEVFYKLPVPPSWFQSFSSSLSMAATPTFLLCWPQGLCFCCSQELEYLPLYPGPKNSPQRPPLLPWLLFIIFLLCLLHSLFICNLNHAYIYSFLFAPSSLTRHQLQDSKDIALFSRKRKLGQCEHTTDSTGSFCKGRSSFRLQEPGHGEKT